MRFLLLLACAACAGSDGGKLTARLQRPHNPEERFAVAARAKYCRGSHGVLVDAASETGNGLLLWLRGDSLAPGEYPLSTASDTTAGRAATASFRYMTGDIGHGLALDSGSVRLAAGPPRLAGDIVGVGTELGNLQRVTVIAHFAGVAVTDTTTCAPS